MALRISPSFQSHADAIREMLIDDLALRRHGVEILRATADERGILVRARVGARTLSFQQGARWRETPVPRLAEAFRREILADAYGANLVMRAPRWHRGGIAAS